MKPISLFQLTGLILALAVPADAAQTTSPPSATSLFQSAVTQYMAAHSSAQAWLMKVRMGQLGSMHMYMHMLRSGESSYNKMTMKMKMGNIPGVTPAESKQLAKETHAFGVTVYTYTNPREVTVYTPLTNSYYVQPVTNDLASLFTPSAGNVMGMIKQIEAVANKPGSFVVKPGNYRGEPVWWVTMNPEVVSKIAMQEMAKSQALMQGKAGANGPTENSGAQAEGVSPMPTNFMSMFSGMFKDAYISVAFTRSDKSVLGMRMRMQVPGLAKPVTANMVLLASKTNVNIPASKFTFVPPAEAKKVDGFMGMSAGAKVH